VPDAALRLTESLADRYVIERELGAGGMARVYLARDIRHDRRVALKLLDPELGAVLGGERFLAEIRVTANLQHPHLLPLFDSGEAGGLLFYVMPYVEGESLRARLEREKQLPVDEAIRIAVVVAGALDYAHRQGVIHRDLKPDNILLEHGEPVVADFGIALAISNAGGSRVTQTGLSLGTPQYMSPEQATGDHVLDGRSDIYSLAAVLYEMLVGDVPHPGSTSQVIVAKLLVERPTSVRLLRPAVPQPVAAAIERALEKLPADRWATAREFAEALKERSAPADASVQAATIATTTPRATRRFASPVVAAVALTVVLAAVGGALMRDRLRAPVTPAPTAVRFPLTFAPNERIATAMGSPLAISPDGAVIAYAGVGGSGVQQLFVRALSEIRARPVSGTEDGERPVFSPNGEWLGFMAKGQFKRVPVAGGTAMPLPEVSYVNGASWVSNDQIVISSQHRLVAMPVNGGPLRPLTRLDSAAGETGHRWPRVLADGRTLLYTSWRSGPADARIAAVDLETGAITPLDIPGTFPLGVLDDQLIYASATGALMAVPFDARRRRVTGTPRPVIDKVVMGSDGAAHAELSASGSLIYQVGRSMMQIVSRNGRGGTRLVIGEPRTYQFPRYSPDGSRIAVTVVSESSTDIWTYTIGSGTLTRLTTEGAVNDRPEWSPDGRRVLYSSNRGNGVALWWQPADGSGRPERLLDLPGADVLEGVLSADGEWLVYRTGSGQDIWARRLQGDTTPLAVAVSSAAEFAPRLSADGRWVAYSSEESGLAQVYVRPFPSLGARYQVSIDGGTEPLWSPDGRRLFYRRNRMVMAVTYATSSGFTVTARENLFEGDFTFQAVHAEYDVRRDGTEVLVPRLAGSDVQTIVVQNWAHELRSRGAAASPR
jgi:serine/threonine-protein kinase